MNLIITKNKQTLRKYFSNFYLNKVYAISLLKNGKAEVAGTFDTIKEAKEFYK